MHLRKIFIYSFIIFFCSGCFQQKKHNEVARQLAAEQENYYDQIFPLQEEGFALADRINESVKAYNQLNTTDGGIITQEKTAILMELLQQKDQLNQMQLQKSKIQSEYTQKIQNMVGLLIDPSETIFKQELKEYTPEN